MKIYFNLVDGYVSGWGSTSNGLDNEISIELPSDHDFFKNDANIYKYEDGELIKDEERKKELQEETKPSDDELNAMALMELSEKIEGDG